MLRKAKILFAIFSIVCAFILPTAAFALTPEQQAQVAQMRQTAAAYRATAANLTDQTGRQGWLQQAAALEAQANALEGTSSSPTGSRSSSSADDEDPRRNIKVGSPEAQTKVDVTAGGLFKGLSVGCFRDGSCTLCDGLLVFINVANSILRILAIVATIFFVYGAGLLMLSQGNEDYVDRGKKAMKATIVGVLITLCAWQIMSVVVWVLASRQNEVFDDTGTSRQTRTTQYNPITSWYTVADTCRPSR